MKKKVQLSEITPSLKLNVLFVYILFYLSDKLAIIYSILKNRFFNIL